MAIVANTVEKLLLAAPRGYCAGVDRAVQTVERALELHGAPVYVRKEIVHNKHVVEELARARRDLRRGAHRSPRGGRLRVLRPRRRAERARGRRASAACRRSTRPARSSRRCTARRVTLRRRTATRSCSSATTATRRSKARWARRPSGSCSCRTSRTSSARGRGPRADRLHHPDDAGGRRNDGDPRSGCASASRRSSGPRTDDICYATTNRQAAVKQMAGNCDLMLVIGSRNSSNSVRLVEVARDCGTEAHLIDNAGEVQEEWLEGGASVGISSGASAPENLVAGARRAVPRARRQRHLGVRRRQGGRPLHAPEADPRGRRRRRRASG